MTVYNRAIYIYSWPYKFFAASRCETPDGWQKLFIIGHGTGQPMKIGKTKKVAPGGCPLLLLHYFSFFLSPLIIGENSSSMEVDS